MSNDVDHEARAAAAARWVARRDAGWTSVERTEFERWHAADPRNAAAWAQYSAAWSALDRPHQATAVIRELRARTRRRRTVMASAGAAIAFCLLVTVAWRTRSASSEPPLATAEPRGLLVAPEKRILSDGTVVELKSGAEIAVEFTDTLRRVRLLSGEAHFQVAKNKEWPFAVDAGDLQVRAVGTGFSVQRDASQIEVVVTEGRIAIEKASAEGERAAPSGVSEASVALPQAKPLAFADAGQRVVVPAHSDPQPAAVVAVSADELARRFAWRAPRVEFSATPLAEAVAMMNRFSGAGASRIQLVIDPSCANLAKEPISGMFRADNAETFVRMMELSLGVQAERKGSQIVLKKSQ